MSSLFQKYVIAKSDGSPVNPSADYFVLRLDTDPAARVAARAYADAIESVDPALAEGLRGRCKVYDQIDARLGAKR